MQQEHATPRRRRAIGIVAALVVVAVALAAIPVTRTAIMDTACDLLGVACAAPWQEDDPRAEDDDWRLEHSPEDAATWGHYVALGDSYSSGDGADDYATATPKDVGCYRSANAYPHLLTSRYAFAGTLSLAACSGIWGHTLLEEVGDRDAQLDLLDEQTSLITLGVGGNDMRFTTVMRNCMLRVPVLDRNACTGQEEDIDIRREHFIDTTLPELVAEVRDRSPDARLLVVGYPRIFPEDSSGLYYTLGAEDQAWLNDMVDQFNEEVSEVVAEVDDQLAEQDTTGSVEYVDVSDSLSGHEVGTEDPWVHGVRLERGEVHGITVDRSTFHPTSEGQHALADRVESQIAEGPDRPLYVARETLASLDPDVLAARQD